MNDDKDLNHLTVPIKPWVEEFCCPICFEMISSATMTPCGHVFCSACISECINRQPKCPSCNHEVQARELVKNKHADRLTALVVKQKEVASKVYFEKLLAGGLSQSASNLSASQTEILTARKLSPIEALFHEHMRGSLQVFDSFLGEINKKCEAAKSDIKKEYVDKMEQAAKKYKGDELSQRVAQLAARCEASCARLETGRAESERLLLEQFGAHLRSTGATPERLPVTVRVRLARRSSSVAYRVTLRPADSCGDAIRTAFATRQRERGDPVLSWGDDVRFVLNRLTDTIDLKPDVALGTQGIENDSEIVIHGTVSLESEKPHKCFAATFVAGEVVDYYSCKECASKWICAECMKCCHAGHTLSMFAEKHQPTWACCYCAKKGNCKIK